MRVGQLVLMLEIKCMVFTKVINETIVLSLFTVTILRRKHPTKSLKTTQVIPTRHIVSTSTIENLKFLECKSIVYSQFFYYH